jgi:hypothetical protein
VFSIPTIFLALAYRDGGVVVWWCGDADACGGDGGDD